MCVCVCVCVCSEGTHGDDHVMSNSTPGEMTALDCVKMCYEEGCAG